ncbi:histone deacetylase 15 isoform X2 [Magnolia sinica]|nr:histone deacetylase 15 isoform X2 [Magnolia sinica]XP_058107921.1 histone deacetylase 15 isoform X2 [Magnolia sinica]
MSCANGRVFGAESKAHERIDRAQCQNTCERDGSSGPQGISNCNVPGNRIDFLPESRTDGHISSTSNDSDTVAERDAGFHSEDQRSLDYLRQQTGPTLEEHSDDDDDDWEPSQDHAVSNKWFCANCTVGNFEDVLHCKGCRECKEYEIPRHSFSSSHIDGEVVTDDVDSKVIGSYGDLCTKEAALGNRTVIGFDERMLLHSEVEMKPHPHPERPDRLRAIMADLATTGIFPGKCFPVPSREITQEELQMVHSLEHIEAVELTRSMLFSYFTPDTYANEHSAHAARLAAGLCADLATVIMSGRAKNGFALVRPPGHHAGIKQAMGFCLHNNAAVAAFAAQSAGAKKVLIVDWDVHHGNGTQEIFDGNRSVLYISLHRHDYGLFYPGTGAANEVGIMGAEGYSVNVPWKRGGVGDDDYIFAFQHVVLPIALEFDPDLTIISAGFDAARGDPLGGCDVTPGGFAKMAYMLSGLSQGKLLVILEGGYNLHSISSSAVAVIKVLLGEHYSFDMDSAVPSNAGLQTVLEVLQVQLKFWPILESNYIQLLSQWKSVSLEMRKRRAKKGKRAFIPIWWKWGRKRSMYHLLYYGKFYQSRAKRHAKCLHLNIP